MPEFLSFVCISGLVSNASSGWRLIDRFASVKLHSEKGKHLCNRAAQSFWSLIYLTPNWTLAQNVMEYQVSGPFGYV